MFATRPSVRSSVSRLKCPNVGRAVQQPTKQEIASKKVQLRIYDVDHNLYSDLTAGWSCTGTYCSEYMEAHM